MGLQVVRDGDPQKIMAAVYSRVSTVGHGQDPAMQTRELREYCQRRGWDIFDSYLDEGVSGKKDSRPELNRMMEDAHARRFDVVVVWRFDRFSRSVSHLLRALENSMLSRSSFSLCRADGHDHSNRQARISILAAVSESERETIVDRVRAGLRNASAKGKTLGDRANSGRGSDRIAKGFRGFVANDSQRDGSVGWNRLRRCPFSAR